MTHTPHEILAEFPEYSDKIHELKTNDAHFVRLIDDYHTVNRAIHRVETNVEPMSETAEKELRQQRMKLKDEIYALIK